MTRGEKCPSCHGAGVTKFGHSKTRWQYCCGEGYLKGRKWIKKSQSTTNLYRVSAQDQQNHLAIPSAKSPCGWDGMGHHGCADRCDGVRR